MNFHVGKLARPAFRYCFGSIGKLRRLLFPCLHLNSSPPKGPGLLRTLSDLEGQADDLKRACRDVDRELDPTKTHGMTMNSTQFAANRSYRNLMLGPEHRPRHPGHRPYSSRGLDLRSRMTFAGPPFMEGRMM